MDRIVDYDITRQSLPQLRQDLHDYRVKFNISLEEMGTILGLSKSVYGRFENGGDPRYVTLMKMLEWAGEFLD
jgi:transcriptional regulator with XRE-family HTH domain